MVTQLKVREPAEKVSEPVEAPAEEARNRALVSVAGLVRGVDVELKTALVGAAVAADDLTVERGFVRTAFAGGELHVRQGGAGVIVSGGDTTIHQGGAQAIISAGTVNMESAGSAFAIGRRIRVAQGGTAVLALTPHLEVGEGGRVIFGRSAAVAIVGAVLSLVALLIFRLRQSARRAPVAQVNPLRGLDWGRLSVALAGRRDAAARQDFNRRLAPLVRRMLDQRNKAA